MPPGQHVCLHCSCLLFFNPRLKDQRYCGRTSANGCETPLAAGHKMATMPITTKPEGRSKTLATEHPD